MIDLTKHGFRVEARAPAGDYKRLDVEDFKNLVEDAFSKFFNIDAIHYSTLHYDTTHALEYCSDLTVKVTLTNTKLRVMKEHDTDSHCHVQVTVNFFGETTSERSEETFILAEGPIRNAILKALPVVCDRMTDQGVFVGVENAVNALKGPHGHVA